MFIAKVIGTVVSTQKTPVMTGQKLLLIEPYVLDPKDQTTLITYGKTLVAVDTVGAGENEFVLIVQGSSARMAPETKTLPVDTAAIGIIDSIHVERRAIKMK